MSRSGYTYVPIGTAYFSRWDFEFRIGHDRDMPCPGRDVAYPDRDIHSGYVLDEGNFWITKMIDSAFSVFMKVVGNCLSFPEPLESSHLNNCSSRYIWILERCSSWNTICIYSKFVQIFVYPNEIRILQVIILWKAWDVFYNC